MGTVQIDGSTPKITVGNATAEDATILFDGNAQDFYIALDDSADDLIIGLGSAVGTTPAISINEDRDVTISDGAIDFDIASHDTSNGLKLGGTLVTATAAELNIMDGVTSTAAELNMVDGSAKSTSSITVADADGIIIIDGTTTKQIPASDLKTYAGFTATTITGTTALAENPQGTDEIILSDAGTLKRLDLKHMMNTPAFFAHGSTATAQAINNNTWTKIANLTTEKLDTDGTFTGSAWTPGVAGYYWVNAQVYLGNLDDQEWGQLQFYTNGTDDLSQNGTLYAQNIKQVSSASDNYVATPSLSMVMYLDADDYVEIYARHNEGSAVNADTQFAWFQGFRITTGVLT